MSSIAGHPRIIAVCGKGGVGKTSISAAIVRVLLRQRDCRVLAVDADPAAGLAASLGMTIVRTVDDIRNSLIKRIESGVKDNKSELLSMLDYEIFEALVEKQNMAFLAIGRPESEGCYCQVNDILKDIIGSIAKNFDYAVIDGEAGIEQVNRRVMESVTHLVLVSDASAKGLMVVRTIKEVSDRSVKYERAGLILNRITNSEEKEQLSLPYGIDFLGWVPEDDAIRSADIKGMSILDITESPALSAVERCMRSAGFLNNRLND